jgi:uncharacterized protein YjeT (DUF2065 family)
MRTTRVVAAAAGLLLVATGLWAFTAPRSFFEAVATYPPFNQHLLHDIGAFNLGLGTTLLLALAWADGLLWRWGGWVWGRRRMRWPTGWTGSWAAPPPIPGT